MLRFGEIKAAKGEFYDAKKKQQTNKQTKNSRYLKC